MGLKQMEVIGSYPAKQAWNLSVRETGSQGRSLSASMFLFGGLRNTAGPYPYTKAVESHPIIALSPGIFLGASNTD